MRYVALLRGINVGGAKKISMAELKRAFSDAEDRVHLAALLQDAIRERTGVNPDLQLRNEGEIAAVVDAIPAEWTNDASMKCDVVFLEPDPDGGDSPVQPSDRPQLQHDPKAARAATRVRAEGSRFASVHLAREAASGPAAASAD